MAEQAWDDMTSYEREKYVNQDYKGQWEVCLPHFENIAKEIDVNGEEEETFWGCIKFDTPTKVKAIIIALHKDGLQTAEIMYHINVSRTYIKRIVRQFKLTSGN